MKQMIFKKHSSSYFILLLVLSLLSCDDLPEPTKEGKDTFGMKLNDDNWERSYSILGNPNGAQYDDETQTLFVVGYNSNKEERIEFTIKGLSTTGTFKASYFRSRAACDDSTRFEISKVCNTSYTLLDSLKSNIEITMFDTKSKVVSGVFEMELENRNGDVLSITEGRFDFQFKPI